MGMIGNTPYQGLIGSGNLQDGAVTTSKVADSALTAAKLAAAAVTDKLGYTPLNKAGDTLSGTILVPDNSAVLRRSVGTEWVLGISGLNANNGVELSLGTAASSGAYNTLSLCSGGKSTIKANKDGFVQMSYQPSFRAYTNPDQSANGVLEGNFWIEQHDNSNNFYQGRFTAPVDGVYLFTCHWDSLSQPAGLGLLVNAGSYYVQWEPTMNSSSWEVYAWSTMVKLSANDYVRLVIQNGSGSGTPIHMGAGYWGHFAGHLLG